MTYKYGEIDYGSELLQNSSLHMRKEKIEETFKENKRPGWITLMMGLETQALYNYLD